jgi:hypothetical protein
VVPVHPLRPPTSLVGQPLPPRRGGNVGQDVLDPAANDGHGQLVQLDSSTPRTRIRYACAGLAHRDLVRGLFGAVRE